MDPSIMKKLLEDDEDESMHSGADVDAFQAALNRDIGGDLPHSQPSGSDSVSMTQGSNSTTSHSLPPFQTTSQNESTNFEIHHDQNIPCPQEINSSEKDPVKQVSMSENNLQHRLKNASQEVRDLPLPHTPVEQNPIQVPQATTEMQISGKNPLTMHEPDRQPIPDSESQYMKLQKMSNQQATVSEQASTAPANRSKQVPFGLLLPVLMNQLDKDKGMQLQELFGKLKREEISKESFVRHIRGVVGEQVLRLAVITVQSQLQSQAARKPTPGVQTAAGSGATQLTDTRAFSQTHPKSTASSTDVSHMPSSKAQAQSNPSHQIIEKKVHMVRDIDSRQLESQPMQASQMPSSNMAATNQERDSIQGLNKQQQQHVHFSQSPFTTAYGGTGGNSHLYSGTNVSTSSLPPRPHPHDSHMRQIQQQQQQQHQNMGSAGEAKGTNNYGVKLERPSSINDPSRMHGGSHTHLASNSTNQQKTIPWQPPTNREQSSGPLSSLPPYVKPESADQSTELQHKLPLSHSQRLPSVSSEQIEQGSMPTGTPREDSFEKWPSTTMGFSTSVNAVPSSTTSMAPPNPVSSSVAMQIDSNIPLGPRALSGTSPAGNNIKTPPKKPTVGQKKPLEGLGSLPPASKKQKVSGNFLDQSIEQLNDVTAVSGVNLREEEEQLFSLPKEDNRVSEASRKAAQEEEERLILEKNPLQRKLAEIMAKCGLKNMSSDVERCLSLSVEERMRGLIDNLIRLSKQRVDCEKAKHHIVTTSDIRLQIMTMNRKAKDEWEKKQAEEEKLRKQNEPESNNVVDGEKEKDEGRNKSSKMPANKEEDDKMRTTAANVAARAAVGGDDMLSKWQLMAEQARQKREGGSDSTSVSQAGKDISRKPSTTPGKTTKDHQEAERRSALAPCGVKKFGRSQVIMPQTGVTRSITVKDIVAVLEMEPQMSKSPIIFRLYEKLRCDATSE